MALPAERHVVWEADRASGRTVRVVAGEVAPLPTQSTPALVAVVCPVCRPERRMLAQVAPVPGAVYETKCRRCKAVVRVAF